MKKVFFSLVALVAIPAALAAAPITVTYSVADTATKYSWGDLSKHPILVVDDVITISATHSEAASSVTNGTYATSTGRWYAYKADSMGEFSIAAKKGYAIQSITVDNEPQKSSVLVEKNSQKEIATQTAFTVNAPSITCQVINGTSGNICARILSFTIVYDVISMAVENQTVKIDDAYQLVATINGVPSNQVAWESADNAVAYVDKNGYMLAVSQGSTNVYAITANGDTATGVITVEESLDISMLEDFANLDEQVEWKNNYTEYTNDDGLTFRVRNFRFSSATELSSGVPGVELQYMVNKKSINFFAYANAKQEGGVKAVYFKWRAVDGTKPVIFDVDSTQNDANINLVSLPANGGYENVQIFSKNLNYEQNMQLRIHIADSASSNIVLGGLAITPYVFYFQKTDTVETPIASYDCTSEDLFINNADGEVSYSIVEDSSEAATISAGVLDLSSIEEECDITVQAAWKGATTTFKLHVKKGTETGLENVNDNDHLSKFIENGQLYIRRGNVLYDAQGQVIK